MEDAEKEGVRRQLEEIETFLDEQSGTVEEFDETLVRRLISKITVYDEKLVFGFKSGLEMDVEA